MSHGWTTPNAWYNIPTHNTDYGAVQIIPPLVPQPPAIIQQIPFNAPLSHPIRPGSAKEDLIDLMMIQNAQMHQVIMNNMTMSALQSFGYGPSENPSTPSVVPVHIEEDDEPVVYHHHYPPMYPTYPAWQQHSPLPRQEPIVRHINQDILPRTPTHIGDQ
ncbi:hypothetical protein GDO86_014437 [Hymenochirus boettgeri]|nr:hypothetical protein GDO86_014437 [Hymenochirus boettgeri]